MERIGDNFALTRPYEGSTHTDIHHIIAQHLSIYKSDDIKQYTVRTMV